MMKIEQQVVERLQNRAETVAVAESCTGGMISAQLVTVPGVSTCFCEGYVTYSNAAKEKNLGVRHDTLERYGAVSEQTAAEMAGGVRQRAQADYGLATTGIAGPDGGSAEKPVGLVYLSCAGPKGIKTLRKVFSGDRDDVRTQATQTALQLLLAVIEGREDRI